MKGVQGRLEEEVINFLSQESSNLKLVLGKEDVYIEIFEEDGDAIKLFLERGGKLLVKSDKAKTEVSKQRLFQEINDGMSPELSIDDLEDKGTFEALLEIRAKIAKNSK